MASKLGVLVVHGMGSQNSKFADPMMEELDDRISDLGADPAQVSWKPVHWAEILKSKEEQLWRDLSQKNRLDFVKLRQFIINAFGDAVAYQRVPGKQADIYDKIHKKVHTELAALRSDLGNADKPLIVLAHSLGSVIMSNYIWDRQKGKDPNEFGGIAFERMETLTVCITFGSNIPLFSLAYDPVESIKFPPGELSPNLLPAAKWLNFYDADDVLGYPLTPLGNRETHPPPNPPGKDYQRYEDSVTKDIEIDAGGVFSSWSPLSHSEYWTDNDFTKPVAKAIADVLRLV